MSTARPRPSLAAVLSVAAGLGLVPAVAHADGPRLRLERVDVKSYPLVTAYLTFTEADGRMITGKQREDFKLVLDSNELGPADSAKPIEQVGQPVYLVIVGEISNAMSEVFEDEKRGIKELVRAASELKGSQVGLIAYSQDIKRVQELGGKPEELDGKVTGLQLDTDSTEVHLLDATRTAIDLLNGKGVPDDARKMVVVFSDGLDVAGGEKKVFTELGKRALLNGIVIDTVGYAPFEKDKLKNLNEMVKQSNGTDRACKNAQEVTAQFGNVADEIRKQYVALFRSSIAGASKEHTIQVVNDNGGKQIWSNNITKILVDSIEQKETPAEVPIWKKWWFWAFCVALPLILLIVVLMKVFGSKEEGAPIVGQEVGPAPGAEYGNANLIRAKGEGAGSMMAPALGGGGDSNRTMALDLGVLTGKGPTVGWIVGITGKYADQTFKLKAGGRTLIGTATDSDIVIDDSFMSSKHCEVRYDGNTYRIVDLGSTNGVVLNDKKVREHDLVDGDTLRLGRTEFKFKSIN